MTALGRAPDDALEGHPGLQLGFVTLVEELAIARVAQDESILGVVEDEPFRDALDRLDKPLLAQPMCVFRAPERGNVVGPRDPFPASEADMAALVSDLRIRDQHVEQL